MAQPTMRLANSFVSLLPAFVLIFGNFAATGSALAAGELPPAGTTAPTSASSKQRSQASSANTELKGPISSAGQSSASQGSSNPGTISPLRGYMNSHPLSDQGILSDDSDGHKPGIITRALGGAATGLGHATAAVLGATILNQSPDLPPDDASSPEWPFSEPRRKALYYVYWADGSSSKVSRLPDGSIQILGSGRRYVLQPESDGKFAMFGDYGSMASVTPYPGGGYTISRADGNISHVLPREGGGYNVVNADGTVTATIMPGLNGKKHVQAHGFSHGFLH